MAYHDVHAIASRLLDRVMTGSKYEKHQQLPSLNNINNTIYTEKWQANRPGQLRMTVSKYEKHLPSQQFLELNGWLLNVGRYQQLGTPQFCVRRRQCLKSSNHYSLAYILNFVVMPPRMSDLHRGIKKHQATGHAPVPVSNRLPLKILLTNAKCTELDGQVFLFTC